MPKREDPTPPDDSTSSDGAAGGSLSERTSPDPGPIDPTDVFARCKVDPAIERHKIGEFRFPLGVYPVEELQPNPGYTLDFESADGGDEEAGEWEEWPDRYVFDAVLTVERVPNLVRCLLSMMPPKVFPILDVLGHDAFREIDPYVAYETVGLDRVIEALKQVPAFFYEDGLCGFGAMSEEPFFYFFVDEHKIVTVRVEAGLKEQVERLMAAFDLTQNEAAGVDAAAHEHRSVLVAPDDEPRMLGFDEVVERLRDDWRLVLNVDPETNVDDEGRDLGKTAWWCRVRVEVPVLRAEGEAAPEGEAEAPLLAETRYIQVVLMAECLREAEEEAILAAERHAGLPSSALRVESLDEEEDDGVAPPFVVFADRMSEDQVEAQRKSASKRKGSAGEAASIVSVKWAD